MQTQLGTAKKKLGRPIEVRPPYSPHSGASAGKLTTMRRARTLSGLAETDCRNASCISGKPA